MNFFQYAELSKLESRIKVWHKVVDMKALLYAKVEMTCQCISDTVHLTEHGLNIVKQCTYATQCKPKS